MSNSVFYKNGDLKVFIASIFDQQHAFKSSQKIIFLCVQRRLYNSTALRSLQAILPFSMGTDGSRSGVSHDQHL